MPPTYIGLWCNWLALITLTDTVQNRTLVAQLTKHDTMNHDITHCSGEGCPKRHKCYRYRAYVEMHIAEVVQVFTEPPYFEGECKFFIED